MGADKAYDQTPFVEACRVMNETPHVAQNTTHRNSAIDARTTRHLGYLISLIIRKLIETVSGDDRCQPVLLAQTLRDTGERLT